MRVVVHLIEASTEEESTRIVEMPETSSMRDLINLLDLPKAHIDHERYYLISDPYWFWRIPYVINKGKIKWYQDHEKVLLSDFFHTHDIKEGSVYIRWWPVPGAGGYWPYEVYQLWEHFYNVLNAAAPILGAGSFAMDVANYLKHFWTTHRNRVPPGELKEVWPSTFFSLVMSRPCWNANELSELTGIRLDACKNFLRACGYRWDRRRMLYVQTEATQEALALMRQAEASPPKRSFRAGF